MILNIYSLFNSVNSQQVLSYGRAERTFIIVCVIDEECDPAALEALDTRALHFALTARLLSSCLDISF
ncbi:hypothetical protein J6590_079804 [Homalodisca vitripennis]|nr:hypothetical protein J6590_079804 [Homalodisca vitripennis]